MRHASRRFTEKDEIATAYHEAGHIVAAVRLGVRVKKATIIGDGTTALCTTPMFSAASA